MVIAIVPVGYHATSEGRVPELYEVEGQSLLERCVTNLIGAGIHEIVILVHTNEISEISRIENTPEILDDEMIHKCREMRCELSIWSATSLESGVAEFSDSDIIVYWATDLWLSEGFEADVDRSGVHYNAAWQDYQARIRFLREMMLRIRQPIACVETGVSWENALHSCAVSRSATGYIMGMLEPETCIPLPDTLDVIRTAICIPAGTLMDLVPVADECGRYPFQILIQQLISHVPGILAVPETGRCFDARIPAEFKAFLASNGGFE